MEQLRLRRLHRLDEVRQDIGAGRRTQYRAPSTSGSIGEATTMTHPPRGTPSPMDVFEAVRTLLAVRSYRDTPVPDAVVRRIVEAGRLTGSGMNRQPWHFVVVRDRNTLRRLGELASSGPYVAEAPLAIVVAIDKTRFAVSDASRAIQSMLLTAWADGVGSNWVGFGGLEKVKDLLDIPAKLEVLAILAFGYPARSIGRGKKDRKPLQEVAYLERFGRPFE
jgi:nitroreductase